MKVNQLIDLLKEFPEDMVVQFYEEDYGHCDNCQLKIKIQSFKLWEDWNPIGCRFDDTKEEATKYILKWWDKVKQRKVLVLIPEL